MDAILARCGGRWPAPPSGHDKYTWDSTGGGFPYGHLTRRASASISSPVTFHHLPVDHLFLYERMRFADSRGPNGEVYRYDFSAFFLKEYTTTSTVLGHQFRVLFGIAVEVRVGDSGSDWRRDFGDPLHMRVVRRAALKSSTMRDHHSPGGTTRFEMVVAKVPEVFNGDGCVAESDDPLRVPLRKAAVVAIQCSPCTPASSTQSEAAGFDQICGVERADACTLRVQLALRCPPREVRTARASPHVPASPVWCHLRNGPFAFLVRRWCTLPHWTLAALLVAAMSCAPAPLQRASRRWLRMAGCPWDILGGRAWRLDVTQVTSCCSPR